MPTSSTGKKAAARTLKAAVLAATVIAMPMAVAGLARAADVPCNSDNSIDGWYGDCDRFPADDDSGGVSGDVFYKSNRTDDQVMFRFRAKGENFYMLNRHHDYRVRASRG